MRENIDLETYFDLKRSLENIIDSDKMEIVIDIVYDSLMDIASREVEENDIEDLKSEINSLEDDIYELNNDKDELEEQIEELKKQLQEANECIANFESEEKTYISRIEELEDEIDILECQ